jgi:hypothetical protein
VGLYKSLLRGNADDCGIASPVQLAQTTFCACRRASTRSGVEQLSWVQPTTGLDDYVLTRLSSNSSPEYRNRYRD